MLTPLPSSLILLPHPASSMSIYSNLMTNTFAAPKPIATSGKKVYDLEYYIKGAAAGGICCSITHGALTPVDVVKTRIQLDPAKYNSGLVGGFKTIVAEEGAGALLTGLGATAGGYFVQGWFKFGGVEFFKIKAVESLGDEKAWALKVRSGCLAKLGAKRVAEEASISERDEEGGRCRGHSSSFSSSLAPPPKYPSNLLPTLPTFPI